MPRRKDTTLQPLGIFHRFLNFIMNSLKCVTTSYHGSNEVPIEDSTTNTDQDRKPVGGKSVHQEHWQRPKDYESSEIMVEFRHGNRLEQMIPIHTPNEDSPHTKLHKGLETMNGIEEKEKSKEDTTMKLGAAVEGQEKQPQKRPIMSNINERAAAFILQKREALRRTTSLDYS
ncbi:uncharacterized protein LOC127789624 isoform X1 [Diospyros lotus]|uniref:uncharacterized protein LOC127789624 isoform X1 n=1 Tax=Diospyros lotus TaxID=55363 RepID=UPI002254E46B|nr:uncharacterized protein LOC127789624 isoform X1 [Diospyros lotus]